MYVPRKSTLAEELYRNVEESGYLKKIYSSLLFNYAVKIFRRNDATVDVNLRDALRFADILLTHRKKVCKNAVNYGKI